MTPDETRAEPRPSDDGIVSAEEAGIWQAFDVVASSEVRRALRSIIAQHAEADALRAEIAALQAEVRRLSGWLEAIDGGESPVTDESELRQMAYRAITLGHPAPGSDRWWSP